VNGTVTCIGHNRGWEEAVASLARVPVHLKTSNAALLQADLASWHDVSDEAAEWELVGVVTPQSGLQQPAAA
jgi:hypothetical protein